jgi:hypothetical protein
LTLNTVGAKKPAHAKKIAPDIFERWDKLFKEARMNEEKADCEDPLTT